jgi:hypothetical protein
MITEPSCTALMVGVEEVLEGLHMLPDMEQMTIA